MWQALLGLIPGILGAAMDSGGSKSTPPPPPKPKPEFQPMTRQPTATRQPMSFDPGTTGTQLQDPQMEALTRFRARLGL